jgi:hypothetical protein
MADLVFNKKKGSLTGFGRFWMARSGIKGKYASLASKTYSVPPRSLMVGTGKDIEVSRNNKYGASPYKDKRGFGWFLWLGEGNLGIHPDGNVPGTQGCIGITNPDTSSLFNELKKRYNQTLSVQVVDE